MTAVTSAEPRRALVLGSAASAWRRSLAPLSWVVLEALAESSRERSGVTVSEKSVRALADELGLAKDTIGRAIQRLQRAGLVSRIDTRSTDGRFGRGCYVLDIPDDLFNSCSARVPYTTTRRAATKSSRRPEQLALLDDTNETRE